MSDTGAGGATFTARSGSDRDVGESGRSGLDPDGVRDRLEGEFGRLATTVAHGELTVHVAPERIVALLAFCRDDHELDFDLLSDLSGVHWPAGEHAVEPQISTTGWPPHRISRDRGTVEVTYHLVSMRRHHRLRVVVAVADDAPRVPSVTEVYPTADFHEREVFDFFGVEFTDHPNLVRILNPEGWEGYPLRKDYPLGGVDTDYEGAHVEPPDERVWARDVPGAAGGDAIGESGSS